MAESDAAAVHRALRAAYGDPGRFVARTGGVVGDWTARAAIAALAEAGFAIVPDSPDHVVDITDESWTLEHPPACRMADRPLSECPMTVAVARAYDCDPDLGCWPGLGRYKVIVTDDDPTHTVEPWYLGWTRLT